MQNKKVLKFRTPETSPKLPAPLTIISVGRDPEILRRRENVLSSQSEFSVRSLMPEEAEQWARSPEPRLWIFCSSIELPRLVHLASSVRRHSPSSRLLLMEGARRPGFELQLFHQAIPPLEGPDFLLNAVSHLAIAV
jgi:hypothetical protein